jgi:release factor glutamine methyltransferase
METLTAMSPPKDKTIRDVLFDAEQQLASQQDHPRLEAEVLLAHVLHRPRSYLHTWPQAIVSLDQAAHYERLVERRCDGEPLAYITGHREFWSLDFLVDHNVLIPRPETELLVELALQRIPRDAAWCIADLGTGSGALALTLVRERPRCHIIATDHSAEAISLARRNMARLGVHNVNFHQGGWLDPFSAHRFQLIVSNPPYVRDDDPHLRRGDVRFEPPEALRAGTEGLDAIHEITRLARDFLLPDGWLLLEHGFDQGSQVSELLASLGYYEVSVYRDLQGLERVCAARWPGA